MVQICQMTLQDFKSIENEFATNFDPFWNTQIFLEELGNTNSNYFIAKQENEIVGLIGIKIVLEQADIMNVITRKDKRKQGIATSLIQHSIAYCKKCSCSTIFLEVNEHNYCAISLYQKIGFVEITRRKKYYDGVADAIIMTYTLS